MADQLKKKKKDKEKPSVKKQTKGQALENSSPVCYANADEIRKEYRDL